MKGECLMLFDTAAQTLASEMSLQSHMDFSKVNHICKVQYSTSTRKIIYSCHDYCKITPGCLIWDDALHTLQLLFALCPKISPVMFRTFFID